jgi:hypothetical protein
LSTALYPFFRMNGLPGVQIPGKRLCLVLFWGAVGE